MRAFAPPDKMAQWSLVAMAELSQSISRDLADKKVFAFHTRIRQPEELYIRTLYALFVASDSELPHILSGAMPNGFSSLYREVNRVVFGGRGLVLEQQLRRSYGTFAPIDALLSGEVFFQSLGHFRDYEDDSIRGDEHEGTSVYKPPEGLLVTNYARGTRFLMPGWSFESTADQEAILIFCTSRVFSPELWSRFKAVACVEILNIARFCARIREALPDETSFLGRRVMYYRAIESGPRWALPDDIATSKLDDYAWQQEYRFVLATPSALEFEKTELRLVRRTSRAVRGLSPHAKRL